MKKPKTFLLAIGEDDGSIAFAEKMENFHRQSHINYNSDCLKTMGWYLIDDAPGNMKWHDVNRERDFANSSAIAWQQEKLRRREECEVREVKDND
jgi:hypothetical protein